MSRLNFTSVTKENRGDFHRLMQTYARELDGHQSRSTAPEVLERWTESIIERQYERGRCLKLCYDGAELVGFLYGKIDLSGDRGYKKVGYGYIMEFFVLTDHRRRGYGGEMLRHMENFFALNGVKRMYLTADPVTGAPFWQKMGFVSAGEVSPENGLEIYEREVRDEVITVTVSDHLTRGLAAEIAAAQWHRAEWADRVTECLYNYKTGSDIFNVIARADGGVIGRLQCMQSVGDPRLWHCGDLFVRPAYRRRHIAEQMLQTALEVLRDRGCRTVRVYIEPENIPSLELHRKHGFSEKPWQPFDELDNEGELMLEKELPCAFEAVPAADKDACYICEAYEKSVEALHGGGLVCHEFFAEIMEMLTLRDPDEENFLIYLGALPCGWIKVNGLESGETGWISMLAVEPKLRRRGAGKFAVNFAADFLADHGKKNIRINTTEDNIPAIRLYESCGFAVCGSHSAASGDGAERVYLTFERNI